MSHPAMPPEIQHIREVRAAAHRLDMACTAIVGGTAMALGKANLEALSEPLPEDMVDAAKRLQKQLESRHEH